MGGPEPTQARRSSLAAAFATTGIVSLSLLSCGGGVETSSTTAGGAGGANGGSGASAGVAGATGGSGTAGTPGSAGGATEPETRPVPLGTDTPRSCGAKGCVPVELAAASDPGQLSVHGEYIYWVERSENEVVRAHRSGDGGREVIAQLDTPLSIEVDDSGVYVVTRPGAVVVRIAHDGSAAETLTTELVEPRSLVLEPESVVVADVAGLYAVPRTPGTPELFFEASALYTWSDWVYVFVSTTDGPLYRVPLSPGTPEQIGDYDVEDMTADDDYLYVLAANGGTSPSLHRHPRSGGTGEVVLDAEVAFDGEMGESVAVDTTHLYVSTFDSTRYLGGLYRIPVAATAPVPTAEVAKLLEIPDLKGLAVDDEAVYVAARDSAGGGRILRLDK